MDLMMMWPMLIIVGAISTCGEPARGFYHREAKSKSSFGDILKPPPPPPPLPSRPLAPPSPFYGGSGPRVERQNHDVGYQYPPPPPPPPLPPTANFRPPSPFYKPYSYNFVPPPQPFLTTPSPSVFNKLQNWLFPPSSPNPSQLTGPSAVADLGPVKKGCNPCNLVPWIPVIRYSAPEKLNFKESVEPTYGAPAGTYGPPAATTTPSYRPPQPFYGPPRQQSSTYNPPSTYYGPPATTYGTPILNYGLPAPSYPNSYSTPSSTYGPPQSAIVDIPQTQLNSPSEEFRLPKVSYPTGFKNSYGEPLTVSYPYNELYPVSATAAESSKIRTEIVPAEEMPRPTNMTYSKPAPFTRHQGRGIHTLQPVALPNLSVSPLPPIFNARPFRTNIPSSFVSHAGHSNKDIKVVPSISVAEFTSSIEYPVKFIQSPIVDIDVQKRRNQTKAYRVIPYSDTDSGPQDASSQASEAHTASANNGIQESSFESTGTAAGNDLYDGFSTIYNRHNEGPLVPPPHPTQASFPLNHRPDFDNLRGMSEATDENGLRSEQHLQSIDSPILYLRPSAPHKDFTSLFSVPNPTSTTSLPAVSEYEIYDDISTPAAPKLSTVSEEWKTNQIFVTPEPTQSPDLNNSPKVVQIIIPYTTGNGPNAGSGQENEWEAAHEGYENQGRKVPLDTESFTSSNSYNDFMYTTPTTPTLRPTEADTEYRERPRLTASSILNDLYDVKEPPFDIVELQHNIDIWTEQKFKDNQDNYKGNYAKKIPDEYFTTLQPYYTTPGSIFRASFYDHEGASSVQHTMKDEFYESATQRAAKEYNHIERYNDNKSQKNRDSQDSKLRPHIYTAASSFRSAPTTVPPWGKIETSISPLTKEKVYVVTAQPWREDGNRSQEWSEGASFESKRTSGLDGDTSASASDNLPFKSPRFSNRPSVPPSGGGRSESMKTESSFSLGKSWHHSINALEWSGGGGGGPVDEQRNSTGAGAASSEGDAIYRPRPTTHSNVDETTETTADTYEATTTESYNVPL